MTVNPVGHRHRARTQACVACGDAELEPFLDLGDVPVETTSLYRTRAEAVAAPMGRMVLHACPTCGLVRNVAFDPVAVAYDTEYENSQHFSPTFQRYAEDLADRLAETYGLRGATVADIGCGKGEFLALLCDRAEAHGVGFDPTYDGQVDSSQRIEIRREFYPGASRDLDVRFVSCRHVLEHLESPEELLLTLRGSLTGPVPVYFEVPNAAHVFTRSGMWDLIYQHVSYFNQRSMRALFERCGFEVTRLTDSFHGQFLSLDAIATHSGDARSTYRPVPPADLTRFAALFDATHERWVDFSREHHGCRVALWGAGAKGVSLLNMTPLGRIVDQVIDVNPRKHGSHVPRTAQLVVGPDSLVDAPPDVVVVANPVYEVEIRARLSELGLDETYLEVV